MFFLYEKTTLVARNKQSVRFVEAGYRTCSCRCRHLVSSGSTPSTSHHRLFRLSTCTATMDCNKCILTYSYCIHEDSVLMQNQASHITHTYIHSNTCRPRPPGSVLCLCVLAWSGHCSLLKSEFMMCGEAL